MTRILTLLAVPALLASAASAVISDNFEKGWNQTTWPIYAPDCTQGGSISLDSTVAHSGKNSLKVVGAGGYCGHIFFGTTQVPKGDVYVRAWVKPKTALPQGHTTFITMLDPSIGTNKHLRLGGQSGILDYNRESDDATLPDLSPQGIATSVPLSTSAFQCLEYHLGTDGTIETWLDSKAIAGLQFGPKAKNPNSNGWGRTAYVPKVSAVYFGWESYGNDANTMWFDDVAIGSTRIGCT